MAVQIVKTYIKILPRVRRLGIRIPGHSTSPRCIQFGKYCLASLVSPRDAS